MDEHVASLTNVYDDLILRRQTPESEVPTLARRAG
jgi:hypothetical protein